MRECPQRAKTVRRRPGGSHTLANPESEPAHRPPLRLCILEASKKTRTWCPDESWTCSLWAPGPAPDLLRFWSVPPL